MSAVHTAIHTPKSLWAKIIEKNRAEARKPDGRPDSFVFFVGPRRAGKSTLLNRFLYPERADVPKPSEGLEYTYARRSREHDHEKKDIAHIWEFGGGDELAAELARVDNIFLSAKQITTAVVVIVLDLSNPSEVLPSAIQWLDRIRSRLGATFEKLEQRGSKLPEQLRIRAKKALYGSNEDKDVVMHTGISIMIAATKYDAFMNQDAELRKVMGRSLRYVAHTNGAHLVYLGGLDGQKLAAEGAQRHNLNPRALLDNFRRALNHLIFSGLEKKMSSRTGKQVDHLHPLMVAAGTDKLRDIGWPKGGDSTDVRTGLQQWKEVYEQVFPPKEKEKVAKFVMDEKYREDAIDSMKQIMDEELEAYRRQHHADNHAKKKVHKSKQGRTDEQRSRSSRAR